MDLHVLPAGPIETNAYLLLAPDRKDAVLIDAPYDVWKDVEPLLAAAGCRLRELWLTHGHWDHMQGAAEVVRATGARVKAHEADRAMFETPEIMRAYTFGDSPLEPVKPDEWVVQGEHFAALGEAMEVRHVPGHCPGNILFYFPQKKWAFVGDAIFAGSIGRTDLVGGNFQELERSIREQIYTLPDETALYPGHGPATTVSREKRSNPYVRP